MSLLNWNAGDVDRNETLLDFICGNWMLALLQEASTKCGKTLAASSGVFWSEAPDGYDGCLAVLAGAAGTKVVSHTYGLNFNGQIVRPYKDVWKEGQRLNAASFYTLDVSWHNDAGELVTRAGLESWRVTTFHMHNDEATKGANGSGGITLAAIFGLAMRDQHRVFAGDFNQAYHYIEKILDTLIATKPEYSAVTYECFKNPHSQEVCTLIFNYPGTVHLTGEVKSAAFHRGSQFWQALGLKPRDFATHYPQVLYIYEKETVGDLSRRQLTHHRSDAGKRKQNKNKRQRAKLKKQTQEAQGSEDLDAP